MEYDSGYAWRATAIFASLVVVVMYTEGMLIPSLPTIERYFGVSESDVSWIITVFLLFGTIVSGILGKLADIYGKKRILMYALSTYTAGAFLTGFAPNFTLLLFARAIQGSGMAMMPLSFALVREEFPPRMIPQVQGIISAMFGVGLAVSIPLGAYVSQNLGWQATYHTVMPVIIIEDVLVYLYIRESRLRNPQRIDWVGTSLLTISLSSGLIAITQAPNLGWSNPLIVMLLVLFALSFIVFLVHESSISNPMVPINLLSNRNVITANLGVLLVGFAVQLMGQASTFMFQMPKPLGYGLDILSSGYMIMPSALTQLVTAPLVGRLITRVGARNMAMLGSSVAAMGFLLQSHVAFLGINYVLLSMVISSVGLTLLNVSLINLLVFSVDPRNMALSTGLNTVFRNMGAAWGPAVAGSILDTYKSPLLISISPTYWIEAPSRYAYQLVFLVTASTFLVLLTLIYLASSEVFMNNKVKASAT